MNGILTLCNYNNSGDIPEINYNSPDEFKSLVEQWLSTKKKFEEAIGFYKTVFVLFPVYKLMEDVLDKGLKYNIQHSEFFVSNDEWEIDVFIENKAEQYADNDSVYDFAIFEFESWEEAFGYCKDLKEGF